MGRAAEWEQASQKGNHHCEVKSKAKVILFMAPSYVFFFLLDSSLILKRTWASADAVILGVIRCIESGQKTVVSKKKKKIRCIESGQSFLEGADISGCDVNVSFFYWFYWLVWVWVFRLIDWYKCEFFLRLLLLSCNWSLKVFYGWSNILSFRLKIFS